MKRPSTLQQPAPPRARQPRSIPAVILPGDRPREGVLEAIYSKVPTAMAGPRPASREFPEFEQGAGI